MATFRRRSPPPWSTSGCGAGVTHAVVCPGSRSTPLALALSSRSDLEVHVRLDERSAAFTALGLGKAAGRPALVVTTSGTAAAELHPAVVEADLAGVPLIACTADRPPELRGVGAPQTIDQTHLFGRSLRWFADPGVPVAATRSSWRSLAARAVAESHGRRQRSRARSTSTCRSESRCSATRRLGGGPAGSAHGRPVAPGAEAARAPPPSGWVAGPRRALRPGAAGPDRGRVRAAVTRPPVAGLSGALGWPVLADPRSGLRTLDPGVIGTADGHPAVDALRRRPPSRRGPVSG